MSAALGQDGAQRASDALALAITVALLLTVAVTRPSWRQIEAGRAVGPDAVMQLTLAEPEPPAPAPTPPSPEHPRPKHHELPQPEVQSAPPAPVDPLPLPAEAVPDQAAVVAATPAPPVPPAHAAANADLESEYAAALREEIERRAHDPGIVTARSRRTVGEVQVRFYVSRAGVPRQVAVMRSSGSAGLDGLAVDVVASGRYAPMPAAIFAGQNEHLFAVTIDFGSANLARSTH